MYLKTISIAASFMTATIFENQLYLVLLLILGGISLYWLLSRFLSIQKERDFLKEENQYFIDFPEYPEPDRISPYSFTDDLQ